MSSRDFYKVTYMNKDSTDRNSRNINSVNTIDTQSDVLDNDTEFNANQFKLYDDFTTDLRIVNFTTLRANLFQDIIDGRMVGRSVVGKSRICDPNDSGVDMENGNQLDDAATSNDSDLVSSLSEVQIVLTQSVNILKKIT